MPHDFTGKTVIVTGGASGIGEAVAAGFCAVGADVLVADLSHDRAAEAAQRMGRGAKGRARGIAVDVADESSVAAMVEAAGPRIDALVCAAGLFLRGTAEATPLAEWNRIISVNLTGSFLCAKAVIPRMRPAGGAIVLLSSSTGAHDAIPGAVAYVASKGGVTLMTKALAVDHAAEGIRVNAIAPGPTDTPMLRGLMSEPDRIAFGQSLPTKRLGLPSDFVGAALFLAGPEAAFVTGAILPVDGGQTALV
jgi:meso-butanediol dehydrogenase / (S,S)-butanediol dehydrogenase / diacetyl reductase